MLIAAFLILSLLLACQPSPPSTPAPSPTPTPTPTPTLTPTPKPSPTPTPTPKPTPTPTPSPTPSPKPSFARYQNDIFGFSLSYPADWQVKETGGFSPVVGIFPPDKELPFLTVSVYYEAEIASPDKVADILVTEILTQPGAKVLSENEVKLEGEVPAYEIIYSLGRGEREGRGILLVTTRGSQAIVLGLVSLRSDFEERSQEFLKCLHSLRLEEPSPFGIPREEALTLFLSGPLTLDPAQATELRSVQYIAQIFSGLVKFTPNLELAPDLAEWWEISPDGKTYTFYLRPNAHFHDGREVTVADVIYSWKRALQTNPRVALIYLGDIVGAREVAEGKTEGIRGIKVIDEKTFQVTIDAPKAYFLAKLTHPVTFVVDKFNVEEGENWWRKPNGTGPFRLKGWQPGIVLALERNPDYYLSPAQIHYIVFRHLGVSPLRMYETSEVDIAFPVIEEIEEINKPDNPLAKELKEWPELSISLVGFNTTKPPFDDPLVRRAFLLASDRERLVKEVLKGRAELAQGFLPPGLPGYNPELTPIPYDPEEARNLLEKSKYGKSLPPLIFLSPGYSIPSPEVEALIRDWERNLGVRVEIKLIRPEQYYLRLEEEIKGANLYTYGWIADYPDPENFLDVLFHSGMINNVGQYTNKEADKLLEKARVESDPQTRFQLYQKVEEILREDAAAIPLSFGREYALIKPFVKGFVVNPQGLMELRSVSLTPQVKTKKP